MREVCYFRGLSINHVQGGVNSHVHPNGRGERIGGRCESYIPSGGSNPLPKKYDWRLAGGDFKARSVVLTLEHLKIDLECGHTNLFCVYGVTKRQGYGERVCVAEGHEHYRGITTGYHFKEGSRES